MVPKRAWFVTEGATDPQTTSVSSGKIDLNPIRPNPHLNYTLLSPLDSPAPVSKPSVATWIGLFFSLFGLVLVRPMVNLVWPSTFSSVGPVLARETGMWIVVVIVLLILTRVEGLPLRTIGIGTARWWRSILWSLGITLASFIVAGMLVAATGYNGGELGKSLDKLPPWLVTLIVVRAGVAEEICYRGYAIERLRALGLPTWLAVCVPLIIFGVAHWKGGWANIVIALALGALLAVVYLWKRDLVANMIAHFLVDFLGNVLPRILR